MKTIRLTFLATVLVVLTSITSYAQKVANYAAGKPGTSSYRGYSFYLTGTKPTEISFRSGADRNESNVTYNGKATYNGKRCFKMTLTGNKVYYAYPVGDKLAIVNATSKKAETYTWEYEGPVDGRGTFCEACAEDEKEAMKLMKSSYLK
ncbi:hypothetical protein DYU05_17640 [Mucilaginibacter terrenus]|uniref:Uncharacterized protein n=1 Tax=Mucilaginibacter terrenus TaxID=2482727 RepID=A0A3E2NL05_9SPHI|nr:hypothetical protein [Mucilaginibacter terrenus]RFZ81651.1 hypothetical protein DYU05_17640 [Mucilaginibacter terrenus]